MYSILHRYGGHLTVQAANKRLSTGVAIVTVEMLLRPDSLRGLTDGLHSKTFPQCDRASYVTSSAVTLQHLRLPPLRYQEETFSVPHTCREQPMKTTVLIWST